MIQTIMEKVDACIQQIRKDNPLLSFPYAEDMDYLTMAVMEEEQLKLVDYEFNCGFSFFMKYYSGTYWSFEQCAWIDAIRAVAEMYRGSRLYYAIMSSLVFAMSYCAQSTGHFAQFRPLKENNYKSVLMYRMKSIPVLFKKKMHELLIVLRNPLRYSFRSATLDYEDCVASLNPETIVYADPPYSAVHYSRFYHVLETIVLYDHPQLEYKGRYRNNRYQSPFDQKSRVESAFEKLFCAVSRQQCHLLLSYSDNALLSEEQLDGIASRCLGAQYNKRRYSKEFKHMKMGRADEYSMNVNELLFSYTKR